MGATFQGDFQTYVILCSQLEWWRDYGKTNNWVLCSYTGCILCVILHSIVSFDSFQSARRFVPLHSRIPDTQMFSFPSKEDVQRSKRNGEKKKKKARVRESGGESDTLTPTCQFGLGPLAAQRPPPLSPTLWFSCLIFKLRNLSRGTKLRQGWKTARAEERGSRSRPGGGNVQAPAEVWSQWRWMVFPKQYVIQQKSNDVSWIYTRQGNVKCYNPISKKLALGRKCK